MCLVYASNIFIAGVVSLRSEGLHVGLMQITCCMGVAGLYVGIVPTLLRLLFIV